MLITGFTFLTQRYIKLRTRKEEWVSSPFHFPYSEIYKMEDKERGTGFLPLFTFLTQRYIKRRTRKEEWVSSPFYYPNSEIYKTEEKERGMGFLPLLLS